MNKIFKTAAVLLIGLIACNPLQLDEVVDPNNPSLATVEVNATKAQIQFIVTGLEVRHRGYVTNVSQAWNSFGREIWYLNSSDPRFLTHWLGQNNNTPTSEFFQFGSTGGGSYAAPYQAIRQAQLLIDVSANTNSVTVEERNAVNGLAKTIMGYQFMIPANFMYGNGIRIDVKDPLNPGPYVSYTQALQHAEDLLDEAYDDLGNAGTGTNAFPFSLTSGWSGYSTINGIRAVNRAIAARLNAYQSDWQGVLDALSGSFINLTGNLQAGPSHPYSGPPDIFNPLFYLPDAAVSTIIAVHPSLIADATPGDKRVADKFYQRITPVTVTTTVGALVGTHQDKRWATNTTAIPFIRNEELILLKAEAHAQLTQTTEAVDAIDIIRTAAQIGDYAGATDLNSLITEILYQRRYSLWAEPWGHRWIDARRYNRLNEIPTTYDQGAIFTQFPRPQADLSWDIYAGN